MQLKKKMSVARKTIVVSAITAAMFMASAPAFASSGSNFSAAAHLSLAADIKGLLKKEIKGGAKNDARSSATGAGKKAEKEDRKDGSATGTRESDQTRSASATSVVSCRTNVSRVQRDAIKLAQTERDAEMRAAREAYLAALLVGRTRYHADIVASASATGSASGTALAARLRARKDGRVRYNDAVKSAQSAYAAAKRKATGDYRDAVRDANDAYHRARLACRVGTTASTR